MAGGCFSTVTVFIRNNNDNYKVKKESKKKKEFQTRILSYVKQFFRSESDIKIY